MRARRLTLVQKYRHYAGKSASQTKSALAEESQPHPRLQDDHFRDDSSASKLPVDVESIEQKSKSAETDVPVAMPTDSLVESVAELLDFAYGKSKYQRERSLAILKAYEGREELLIELLANKTLKKEHEKGPKARQGAGRSMRNDLLHPHSSTPATEVSVVAGSSVDVSFLNADYPVNQILRSNTSQGLVDAAARDHQEAQATANVAEAPSKLVNDASFDSMHLFPRCDESAIELFPAVLSVRDEAMPSIIQTEGSDISSFEQPTLDESADDGSSIEDIVCAWDGEVEVFRSGPLSKYYIEQELKRRKGKQTVAPLPFILNMLSEEFIEISADLQSVCSKTITQQTLRIRSDRFGVGFSSRLTNCRCW